MPVFEELVRRWPTPEDLARARLSSVSAVIRPLGLAKRAPTLKDLGKALAELVGTEEPRSSAGTSER